MSYNEAMIKGRIAEAIVEQLFLSSGYNVFRYGMENTIPGVMELLKGVQGDVVEDIRSMPDFVIQNKNNPNKVYFIEVKFRANGNFNRYDLDKNHPNYPYKNAYIVLVSKQHIKCVKVEELYKNIEITQNSENYLGDRTEFDLDKGKIIKFCKFASKFFENVD